MIDRKSTSVGLLHGFCPVGLVRSGPIRGAMDALRQRPWLAVVAIGMAIALLLWPLRHRPLQPSLHADDPLADGIERAAHYFGTRVLDGDEAWMAQQGAELLGGEFVPWADRLVTDPRLRGTPARLVDIGARELATLSPLPVPEVTPSADDSPLSRNEIYRIRKMMQLSSRCNRLNERQRTTLARLTWPPGRSYVVTHQLWALITAYHLGCIEKQALDNMRGDLARAVYRELLADRAFDDLTAERMAMLCYAGLASWIPEDKIQLALRTQDPAGPWIRHQVAGIGPKVTSSVMHMSTMAFYALAAVWVHRQRTPPSGVAIPAAMSSNGSEQP